MILSTHKGGDELSDNKKELLENLAIAVTLLTGAIQATKAIANKLKKLTKRPKRRKKRKR
jgi:NTP pyrophosphatase (non-canonical NTP hydrolase)